MENRVMNCVLLLPLKEITLRRVVIMLWNQAEVLAQVKSDDFGPDFNRIYLFTRALEAGSRLVTSRLSKLALPPALLSKVTDLIKPIGSEIYYWHWFHAKFLDYPHKYFEKSILGYSDANLDERILLKLRWTTAGTVDYRKTAEELIRLEMLDSILLFKLACFYCLEDRAAVLWERLPRKYKVPRVPEFDEDQDEDDVTIVRASHVDMFWTIILKETGMFRYQVEFTEFFPFLDAECLYIQAAARVPLTGNKAATEYFYRKLANEDTEVPLLEIAKDMAAKEYICAGGTELPVRKLSDVLCFLISQMSLDQRMELLKERTLYVLRCFLEWPWQPLFVDVAENAWRFLSENEYFPLVIKFATTIALCGSTAVDVFRQFFVRSPPEFKDYVIQMLLHPSRFDLFRPDYSLMVMCIFQTIDIAVIVKFLFSEQGFDVCRQLMEDDDWPLLEVIIREAKLSEEQRKSLKTSWKRSISRLRCDPHLKQQWKRVFRLLDEANECASDKRSADEVKAAEAKKMCTG